MEDIDEKKQDLSEPLAGEDILPVDRAHASFDLS